MCGIAGIFNPFGLPSQFKQKERVRSMALLMEHRGPDEKGILISDIAYLGHSRLSIIDQNTGSQPMCSANKKLGIVYNGEIFNYLELRDELKQKGYSFRTKSDTEVLLLLFQEYGNEMLQKLNGQFAFAIIDFENRRLFASRDRIGIRPFYYTFIGDTVIFASSIKAITLNPEVNREFNYSAFQQFSNFWTTYGSTTFVENILSLCPGEYIEISQSLKRTNIYWDLEFPEEKSDDFSLEEWKEKIYYELDQATSLRLRADVPVNSYLSGGIDSSIILNLVKKHHPKNFESFSVRFSEKFFDESKFQKLVTEKTGIKNNHILITPQLIGDSFEQVITHCEQPIFRTAPVPLYHLSNLVNSKSCKVVLTGEGADEVAWGYDIFKETLIRSKLVEAPESPEWLSQILKMNVHLPQYNERYKKFLIEFYKKSLNDPDCPFFSHHIRISNGQYVLNFLTSSAKEKLMQHDCKEEITSQLPKEYNHWNPLQKAQYLEMKTLLAGYLLSSQGDRMSMAHSVEGRYPFLDHNVVQTFAQMPDEFKLNDMTEKYILKQAFGDSLPNAIIDRPKYPYRAPEGMSMIHPEIEAKYLNEEICKKYDIFDWKYVERLIKKIQTRTTVSNFVDNVTLVMITSTLMFLEMLQQNFFLEKIDDSDQDFIEVII